MARRGRLIVTLWALLLVAPATFSAPTQAADCPPGTIHTIAGGGFGEGQPALARPLGEPAAVAVTPDGTVYIADTGFDMIWRLDAAGRLVVVAGAGDPPDGVGDDGPAAQASLSEPECIAFGPEGSIYIADQYHNRIRKIDTAGVITTVAGNGEDDYAGDGGPATKASLDMPGAVVPASDGSMYIADSFNNVIRKVDPVGVITTIAGNGEEGYSGDGGRATEAKLHIPSGVVLAPDGSIYIADTFNHRIRKVDLAGIITTVAGDGWTLERRRDNLPPFMAGRFGGDGGPATKASLYWPHGLALAPDGSLYVADWGNGRVRKINPDGIITTIAGSDESEYSGDGGPAIEAGVSARGVALDAHGNLYIADMHNGRVRKVDTAGIITTIAGSGEPIYLGDGGPAVEAALCWPTAAALAADGSPYIADPGCQRIRKIDAAGVITTVAGDGWVGDYHRGRYSGDGGPATKASLNAPFDVAPGPDGSFYVADTWNHRIRKVDPAGMITTVAGDGWAVESPGDHRPPIIAGRFAGDGGPAAKASLSSPEGVAVAPDGTVYIADSHNHRVRKIDPAGVITTFAGDGWARDIGRGLTCGRFAGDGGPAAQASLFMPSDVAVAPDGSVYIADTMNNRIRKVDAAGIIITVAGSGKEGYSGDGEPATAAELGNPQQLAVGPDGSLYIADTGNHCIRRVDPAGIITTVAGRGPGEEVEKHPLDFGEGGGFSGDGGPAVAAELDGPRGIAVAADGTLYIVDTDNARIRKVCP